MKQRFGYNITFLLFGALLMLAQCRKKEKVTAIDRISVQGSDEWRDILFLTEQKGFMVGGVRYEKARILKTEDGGSTWSEASLPSNAESKILYDIESNGQGGLLATGYSGIVFKSSDSGQTWQYLQEPYWKEWHGIAFIHPDTAVLCGGESFGRGFLTKLDLQNDVFFDLDTSGFQVEFRKIKAVANRVLYACGYGAVIRSESSAETWEYTTAQNDYFFDMYWFNTREGVLIGKEGSICKTNNAGLSWKTIRSANAIQSKKRFEAIDAWGKLMVIVGEKGLIWISEDQGETWRSVLTDITEDLTGLDIVSENVWWVVGKKGAVYKIIRA